MSTGEEKPKRPYNQLKSKVIALTMLDVFKSTGKINMTEVSKRLKPNVSEDTHNAHGFEMLDDEVIRQFSKLMKCDDAAVSKLNADFVLRDILNDIHVANQMIESPGAMLEDVQKFMNIKTAKQKLLASYLGMLQGEEKPAEDKNPDNIFKSTFGS
jgi:hypothetical protein